MTKLLVVDSNRGDVRLIRDVLSEVASRDMTIDHVDRLASARQKLRDDAYDCVLLDLDLPDSSGLGTLESLREEDPDVSVIVLTAATGAVPAEDIMRAGAQDYLAKTDIGSGVLRRSIQHAMERNAIRKSLKRLTTELQEAVDKLAMRNRQMVSMLEDVQQARLDIERERATLQIAVQSMAQGLVLFAADGEIVLSNRVAKRMFEVDEEGDFTLSQAGASSWFPLREFTREVLEGGGELSIDVLASVKPERLINVRAVPLRMGGALATLTDVTKERELETARKNLLAMVSHELRTPITLVKLFLANAEAGVLGDPGETMKAGVVRAIVATNRLANLVDNLLDFSRMERGAIRILFETTSVNSIIRNLRKIYDQRMAEEGRAFSISVDMADPAIRCDSMKLVMVLSNCLDNAIKFTQPGGRIELRVSGSGDEVVFGVSDDGIGIPKEYHDSVFEKFVQIGRDFGPGAKGLGLGLALCKEVVERHGGRIWVESEPGRGSTFTFVLPRHGPKTSGDEVAVS